MRPEVGCFDSPRFAATDARETAHESLVGFVSLGWLWLSRLEVGGDLIEGHFSASRIACSAMRTHANTVSLVLWSFEAYPICRICFRAANITGAERIIFAAA